MIPRTLLAVAAASLALLLTGCGSGDPDQANPPAGSGREDPGVTGPVTVFAAASLTETFTSIGREFEAANPGVQVTFNFAGSSALAMQINQGAPVDVFASAAPANMTTIVEAGNADGIPIIFARNQLIIAVPIGNPRGIVGLADLAAPGIKVAHCAEQVPCGAAAKKAVGAAGRKLTPVTFEQDVKAALAKVKLGEVDAVLVYRTDVKAAAAEVVGIDFPESVEAINDYPIALLRHAPNRAGAQAFIAFVRSDRGRTILAAAGFQVQRP